MLLTRLPLSIATSFDLHVLGTPPALVLSQDQTLHKKFYGKPIVAPKIRAPFQNRLRCGSHPEGCRRKLYVLAILKDIAKIDLVLEVGDPQT